MVPGWERYIAGPPSLQVKSTNTALVRHQLKADELHAPRGWGSQIGARAKERIRETVFWMPNGPSDQTRNVANTNRPGCPGRFVLQSSCACRCYAFGLRV